MSMGKMLGLLSSQLQPIQTWKPHPGASSVAVCPAFHHICDVPWGVILFFRFWRSSWLLHRRCHMVPRQWAVIVLAPWWAFVIVPLKWKRLSWPFFSEKWFSQPLLTLWVNKSAFLGWNENRTLTHALTAHPLTYLLTTAEIETWRFSNHSCLGVMGIILCEENTEGRQEHLLLWK